MDTTRQTHSHAASGHQYTPRFTYFVKTGFLMHIVFLFQALFITLPRSKRFHALVAEYVSLVHLFVCNQD